MASSSNNNRFFFTDLSDNIDVLDTFNDYFGITTDNEDTDSDDSDKEDFISSIIDTNEDYKEVVGRLEDQENLRVQSAIGQF